MVFEHMPQVEIWFDLLSLQEMLGEAELAAAKKLSENEARVTELTDRWKDRWRETQRILEVQFLKIYSLFFTMVLKYW